MPRKQSIFREEALRRYRQRNLEPVFPRLVSPNGFFFLWILVGCLVAAGLLSWLARIPVYATGLAIVVERIELAGDSSKYWMLTVLEAEALPNLKAGQKVLIDSGPQRASLEKIILAVEPDILAPSVVESRFGLGRSVVDRLDRPCALAWVSWGQLPGEVQSADFVGATFRARVEIGSRRLISLLPGFGPLGGGGR